MTRLLLILLLAVNAHAASKAPPAPVPSPSPVAVASPVPAGPLKVQFSPVDFYSTPSERIKIKKAGELLNRVVASACFKDFMAARKLIQTNGRAPSEVATHVQGLTGIVPVKMYYRRFTSAVAYRQPPSMEINLNRKAFWPDLDDCEWGSTLAHESLGHSLGGYDHDYKWNAQRDFSVPYSLNAAFDACCAKVAKLK